jgi:hypothetical protein
MRRFGGKTVSMPKWSRLAKIFIAGAVILGVAVAWFFGNLFYSLFWALLEKWHVPIKEADVIAYTLAHLVPFAAVLVISAIFYFAVRSELARPDIITDASKALPKNVSYLSACDYDLGPAIIEMAYRSAWGRWFAAQQLATMGNPIDERYRFQTAASKVWDKMRDGDLIVRGRMHGQTGSQAIPATDWRDVALYYFPDNRALWRLCILPREAVTIQDDQVIDTDLSMETVSHITQYDNLLIDSRQFENLWPITDRIADSERRRLLEEARRRKLDLNTIQALS